MILIIITIHVILKVGQNLNSRSWIFKIIINLKRCGIKGEPTKTILISRQPLISELICMKQLHCPKMSSLHDEPLRKKKRSVAFEIQCVPSHITSSHLTLPVCALKWSMLVWYIIYLLILPAASPSAGNVSDCGMGKYFNQAARDTHSHDAPASKNKCWPDKGKRTDVCASVRVWLRVPSEVCQDQSRAGNLVPLCLPLQWADKD